MRKTVYSLHISHKFKFYDDKNIERIKHFFVKCYGKIKSSMEMVLVIKQR